MIAFPPTCGIVAGMKRSGACSLRAYELRGPRTDCLFSQVEKVGDITRPHPVPLLQERENDPSQSWNPSDGICRARIVTSGVGGKPFLLMGERAGVGMSHEKPGFQAPANRPRKSVISKKVSDSSDGWGKSLIFIIFLDISTCLLSKEW